MFPIEPSHQNHDDSQPQMTLDHEACFFPAAEKPETVIGFFMLLSGLTFLMPFGLVVMMGVGFWGESIGRYGCWDLGIWGFGDLMLGRWCGM